MENYKLYMHIFPNKKVYVGITKETLARRWLNGNGYRRQPVVFSAIMKYGWDNIQHILLREGMTKEQAMQAEKEYIRQKQARAEARNKARKRKRELSG